MNRIDSFKIMGFDEFLCVMYIMEKYLYNDMLRHLLAAVGD
jgi:hypothetical protein